MGGRTAWKSLKIFKTVFFQDLERPWKDNRTLKVLEFDVTGSWKFWYLSYHGLKIIQLPPEMLEILKVIVIILRPTVQIFFFFFSLRLFVPLFLNLFSHACFYCGKLVKHCWNRYGKLTWKSLKSPSIFSPKLCPLYTSVPVIFHIA